MSAATVPITVPAGTGSLRWNTVTKPGGNDTLHWINADCAPAKLRPAAFAPLSPSAGGPSATWNVSTGSASSSLRISTSTGFAVSPGWKETTSSTAS